VVGAEADTRPTKPIGSGDCRSSYVAFAWSWPHSCAPRSCCSSI